MERQKQSRGFQGLEGRASGGIAASWLRGCTLGYANLLELDGGDCVTAL